MNTMSAPLITSSISSRCASAACAADLGVAAGAEAAGEVAADVELDVGVAHQQRLGVGVDGDELDALQPGVDHAVDGVDAAAADADDLDDGEIVLGCAGHQRYLRRSSRCGRLAVDRRSSSVALERSFRGSAHRDAQSRTSTASRTVDADAHDRTLNRRSQTVDLGGRHVELPIRRRGRRRTSMRRDGPACRSIARRRCRAPTAPRRRVGASSSSVSSPVVASTPIDVGDRADLGGQGERRAAPRRRTPCRPNCAGARCRAPVPVMQQVVDRLAGEHGEHPPVAVDHPELPSVPG